MKSQKRIEITKRDLEILQFIFERRAVTHQQIAKVFFPSSHRCVPHKRLVKICKTGFLSKKSLYGDRQILFYSLTDKGISEVKKVYKYEMSNANYKSDSIHHDIGLVEVRKRLEEMSMVVDYLSESMLQSCIDLIESDKFNQFSILNSDAVLVIDTQKSQFQVAIEYEVSNKSEARYIRKLSDYYLSDKIEGIFYICGNSHIEKLIRNADLIAGEKHEAKVFTCLEENLQLSSESITFRNRNNSLFILK
jgi:hypothetical protein